ncbi:MAG: amino acid permease [Bacteroidota bacterium]
MRAADRAISAITASTTLTLFAFLGLESATIPAENIRNPEKNIAKATIIGTLLTMVIYVLGTIAVMGILPPEVLKTSQAPFADAAAAIWGETARYLVAGGAVIATFGALDGWILIQGQMPMAAARDKLFPAFFTIKNKKGMPIVSIIVSSVLISIMMAMNFSRSPRRDIPLHDLIIDIHVIARLQLLNPIVPHPPREGQEAVCNSMDPLRDRYRRICIFDVGYYRLW